MSITFTYGTVSSGKSARMIIAYDIDNYRGLKTLLIKPKLDDRDGSFVKTRFEEARRSCLLWDEDTTLEEIFIKNGKKIDSLFIDEVQFLSKKQADEIKTMSMLIPDLDIQLYGLMTDYLGKLFEGTKLVLEMTDHIKEVENKCWCKAKATKNAKIDSDGNVIKKPDSDNIDIGYHYVPLCSHHFNNGITNIKKNKIS